MADTDAQRLNCLESKIGSMDTQLSQIKSLLMKQTESVKKDAKKNSIPDKTNAWLNGENWVKVKAPPTPAVLVVENTVDDEKNKENIQIVEKKIMENNPFAKNIS